MVSNIESSSLDQIFQLLNSSKNGLTDQIANEKLATLGPNTITLSKSETLLKKILTEFKNPLLLLLIGVSIVSLVMGEYIDAGIVFSMVVISSFLNIY